MDVDAAGASGRGAARLFGVAVALHAGREAEQIVPVAQRQRQLRDFRLADDRAERRLFGVHQRRHRFDADALLEAADREGEIHARALTRIQRDALARLAESLQFHLDDVFAGNQRADDIRALRIADRDRRNVRRDASCRHRGARHHRVGLILHRTRERRALHLRVRVRRRREQQQRAAAHGVQPSPHD